MGFFSELHMILDSFPYLPDVVLKNQYGDGWHVEGMDVYVNGVKFIVDEQ